MIDTIETFAILVIILASLARVVIEALVGKGKGKGEAAEDQGPLEETLGPAPRRGEGRGDLLRDLGVPDEALDDIRGVPVAAARDQDEDEYADTRWSAREADTGRRRGGHPPSALGMPEVPSAPPARAPQPPPPPRPARPPARPPASIADGRTLIPREAPKPTRLPPPPPGVAASAPPRILDSGSLATEGPLIESSYDELEKTRSLVLETVSGPGEAVLPGGVVPGAGAQAGALGATIRRELRGGGASAARAVVLAEILGPAPGLRRDLTEPAQRSLPGES